MYFNVKFFVKFFITIGNIHQIELLVIHMTEATHSDHPNHLLPSHCIEFRLVVQLHGPIVNNMVKRMQEKFAN